MKIKQLLFIPLVISTAFSKSNNSFNNEVVKQEVRTVSLNDDNLVDEDIYDDFDSHSVSEDEDGFLINE